MDAMRRGRRRGLGFSGVVTVGNCADLGAADLLEFFLADPQTRVVGLYLEDAKDGRRLFELMAGAAKPIVLLKGGRSRQGRRAALSHTGALASDDRIWAALARQTGAALVDTLDAFVDALLAFQTLTPRPQRPTRRVALFGNGGGASVLAADYFARCGLDVAGFGAATAAALRRLALPAGSSVANPIDVPANILRRNNAEAAGHILEAVLANGEADAVVMHINMPVVLDYPQTDMLGNLIEAALQAARRHPGQAHLVLVLRSDGEPEIEEKKAGLPHPCAGGRHPGLRRIARRRGGAGRAGRLRARPARRSGLNDLVLPQRRDFVRAIAGLGQDLVGMLAERRRGAVDAAIAVGKAKSRPGEPQRAMSAVHLLHQPAMGDLRVAHDLADRPDAGARHVGRGQPRFPGLGVGPGQRPFDDLAQRRGMLAATGPVRKPRVGERIRPAERVHQIPELPVGHDRQHQIAVAGGKAVAGRLAGRREVAEEPVPMSGHGVLGDLGPEKGQRRIEHRHIDELALAGLGALKEGAGDGEGPGHAADRVAQRKAGAGRAPSPRGR